MSELITPLLVSIAVTAAILLPVAWTPRISAARWAGAAALGLGFAAGFVVRAGWRAVPPVEHWHWIGVLAILAALAAGLQGIEVVPRALRTAVVLAAIGLIGWRIVPGFVEPDSARLGWRIATVFTLLVLWIAPAWVARTMGSRTTAIVLWLHATGLAIFLVTAHTALLGLVAGLAAACMGVFVVVAWWRPELPFPQTVVPLSAAIALAVALTACFYSDLGHTPYMLVAIAPLVLSIGRLVRIERLGGWRAGLVHVVLLMIPIATAVLLAIRASAAADPGNAYEDY